MPFYSDWKKRLLLRSKTINSFDSLVRLLRGDAAKSMQLEVIRCFEKEQMMTVRLPDSGISRLQQHIVHLAHIENPRYISFDRDGVINTDLGRHVTCWSEFAFRADVKPAAEKSARAGYAWIIVTNQQGVALGKMTEQDLHDIHRKMIARIEDDCGGLVAGVFYCPHLDGTCYCRKPGPILFQEAFAFFGISKIKAADLFYIGDSQRDIEAAKHPQVQMRAILLGTKFKMKRNFKDWPVQPDFYRRKLPAAIDIVLKE